MERTNNNEGGYINLSKKENETFVAEEIPKTISVPINKNDEPLVYVGPTIKNLVESNTCFNNGLPEVLKERCDKCSTLSALVVPLSKYAEVSKELAIDDSSMALFYEKVRKEIDNDKL